MIGRILTIIFSLVIGFVAGTLVGRIVLDLLFKKLAGGGI